jgi:hypothetical protein
MEKAGPNGALVLFNLYAPEGVLAESLNQDGSVIRQATLEQLLKKA